LTSGAVQDGTVIWCQKWNQRCFNVAFYFNAALITVQFTLQESHSLKLQFVRKLWDALKKENLPLHNCVHVGVREKQWTALQFQSDKSGTGRPTLDEEAEFVVDVYRSPPIESASNKSVECNMAGNMLLFSEKMWKLGAKKRRNDQQP
jgi:hypothetical protein